MCVLLGVNKIPLVGESVLPHTPQIIATAPTYHHSFKHTQIYPLYNNIIPTYNSINPKSLTACLTPNLFVQVYKTLSIYLHTHHKYQNTLQHTLYNIHTILHPIIHPHILNIILPNNSQHIHIPQAHTYLQQQLILKSILAIYVVAGCVCVKKISIYLIYPMRHNGIHCASLGGDGLQCASLEPSVKIVRKNGLAGSPLALTVECSQSDQFSH